MNRLYALVLVTWLLPHAARAEPPPVSFVDEARAMALVTNGLELVAQRKVPLAVTAFEQAYTLCGRAAILHDIADAQAHGGAFHEAEVALARFQAAASPDERHALRRRTEALEARLRAAGIAVSHTVDTTEERPRRRR